MSEMKRATPPSPAPRPIARLLLGCAGMPLFEEVGEKVGVAGVLDAMTEEAVVVENEEGEDRDVEVVASTAVVSRRNTPCSLWQHDELLSPQQ